MAMASKIRYCVSPFASLGQKDWKKFAERNSNWSYAGRIFVWGGVQPLQYTVGTGLFILILLQTHKRFGRKSLLEWDKFCHYQYLFRGTKAF